MLTAILSFLTGCLPRPAPLPPKPERPGLTYALQYPVLLLFERRVEVRDDEQSLLTTRITTGLNFREARIVEPSGGLSTVARVTPFGQKSWLLDMGTSPFQMFLDLRRGKPLPLDKAKALVMEVVHQPYGAYADSPRSLQNATEKVNACRTVRELIEACRESW